MYIQVTCVILAAAARRTQGHREDCYSMSIAVTVEHLALAEVASDFLTKREVRTEARELLETDAERLPSIWPSLAELGWLGLHVDAGYGGAGFGLAELVIVVEALGRTLASGPFVPTVIASAVIAATGSEGQRAELLPGLTDGSIVGALGLKAELEASGARVLVADDGATAPGGVSTLAVGDLDDEVVGWDQPRQLDASTLALLIFTSGTTAPKGVMLDHANLDAMAEMGRQALGIRPTDRCLLILPLFHVNGIVVSVLMPVLAGASVVIAERFDVGTFFDVIEAERPTFFSAVPTIDTMLAALPDDVRPDMSSVRFGICGAAPASAELLGRFETRYGFPLIEGYGLSEATRASTINPATGERRAGTVGTAFPGQQIRIVDEGGTDVATGVAGEVLIAGPNVMRGYLGRADETARVIIDGWLHTGDIGHLDTDGYLTLVGGPRT